MVLRPRTPDAFADLVLGRPDDWRAFALCVGDDPAGWDDDGADEATVERAIRICRRCRSLVDCLRDALEVNEQHTVRGGLRAKERKGMTVDEIPEAS